MASEAKDVGILAMDIYFPPNCVLQVPSPVAISVSPRARFAFPFGPSLGFAVVGGITGHARTLRLFDSKARGQAAWTPTQHHHTLCVVPLRLRDLFTVAAGLGF